MNEKKRMFNLFPLHPITERIALAAQVLCVLVLAIICLTGCGAGPAARTVRVTVLQWIGLVVVIVGIPVSWIILGLEHAGRTHIFTERRLRAGMYIMLVVCFITAVLIVVSLAHRGPFTPALAPTPTPTPIPEIAKEGVLGPCADVEYTKAVAEIEDEDGEVAWRFTMYFSEQECCPTLVPLERGNKRTVTLEFPRHGIGYECFTYHGRQMYVDLYLLPDFGRGSHFLFVPFGTTWVGEKELQLEAAYVVTQTIDGTPFESTYWEVVD